MEEKTFNMQGVYCEKTNDKCLCRNCPENKTYNTDGNCIGCDGCNKTGFLCLVTGYIVGE